MSEIARVLEPLLAEAEMSFATTPKALWSTRSYLAPKDVTAIRAALQRSSAPADVAEGHHTHVSKGGPK